MDGISKRLVAIGLTVAGWGSLCWGAEAVIIVQRSPLAGIRHYEAGAVWRNMAAGDPLELVREPDNQYDPNAVRIDWRGRKLGYLPRRDNDAVARQLDRGAALEARVAQLKENRNRSVRLDVEVVVSLQGK